MDRSLQRSAELAIRHCLGVKDGESILIVTDLEREQIGRALWSAALEAGGDAVLSLVRPRLTHGEEPPEPVAVAMKEADVVLAPTSWSISHTRARREACEAGTRVATLPSITPDIMGRALNTDYDEMARISTELADRLTRGTHVHLSTPAGTDIEFSLAGRSAEADTGILTEAGSFGNLPAGEAFIAPVEGSARGRVVIDGSMAGIGIVDQPIVIEVADGLAGSVSGGEAADRLRVMLDAAGPAARNLAELGIGTNRSAVICGNVLEDEKAWGTVHIAFGSNRGFGGTVDVPLHLDGILYRPTLAVDGQQVLVDGELC